jgi:TonB family protein
MHKSLILLSSFALSGLAPATAQVPGPAMETPAIAYDLSLTLTEAGRTIGTPRVTMRDGDRTGLRSMRDGWMVQLEIDRVPAPAGDGGERAMVDVRLFLRRGGGWELAASPSLVAELGRPARAEIAGGPERPGPIGVELLVNRARATAAGAAPGGPVPKGAIERLVGREDYPASALRAGEDGDVRVTLDVGPNGRATQCTVNASSGSAALDAAACRLLISRARFTPARDANGVAVASVYRTSVQWTLPPGIVPRRDRNPFIVATPVPPPAILAPSPPAPAIGAPAPGSPPVRIVEGPRPRARLQSLIAFADYPASARQAGEQGRTGVELDVAAHGRVTRCTVARSSGSAALDSATCRLLTSRARFTPARDSNGHPAAGRHATEIAWWLAPKVEVEPADDGSWNVAPSAIRYAAGPQPRPLREPQSLIAAADYPASALRAGEQGRTNVLLDVGTNGRVTGCRVTSSSWSSALDSATCRVLVSRARFIPARGADGAPVSSRFSTGISWVLPMESPIP